MSTWNVPTAAPFESVCVSMAAIEHWLRGHCADQKPSRGQYRDDHFKVFDESRIQAIWNPDRRTFRNRLIDAVPLIQDLGNLISPAIDHGSYLLHDEYDLNNRFAKHCAVVVCKPGLVAILEQLRTGWNFTTAYFTHNTDSRTRGYRSTVIRLVQTYTNSTNRLPAPTESVWISKTVRRTNIRFGNSPLWGEHDGHFDPIRIQDW
ncbi:hypothetical protein [Tuwongella immobilis]|uniref:Uncharacterized protein n=1 Tax=Tuwongella immobilis TaxID=692036 RepID=A0A6C2YLC6_9BACT|nr:hypothetical protein [Tuwongella immobilis]VIP01722.1 unnamed protein product [Tuwongella immobilis]VTR99254.1 unnamed protein product [Tuwongella immobilis]